MEYWNIDELPVGELSFLTMRKALNDEKYMRKFKPTFCRNDLMIGHLSALLYWYPHYVNILYELASEGHDYMTYFKGLNKIIPEEFEFLMSDTVLKLNKLQRSSKKNHLDEVKYWSVK